MSYITAGRRFRTPIIPLVPIPVSLGVQRATVPGAGHSVVIIGAGLAGLTAAVRIAATGRHVTVVEAGPHPGGRAATEWVDTAKGAVRVDTGATVLTMPDLLDSTLGAAGLRIEDVCPDFRLLRVDPAYGAVFASRRRLDVYSDPDRMSAELTRFAKEKGLVAPDLVSGYQSFRRWAQDLYNAAFESFIAADFDRLDDVVATPDSASDLARVIRLGGLGSLGRGVARRIPDAEVGRLFSFQALYAGVSPQAARAVYATICHMDTGQGVFYPAGGIGQVAEVLARAVTQLGGTILYNTAATRIVHSGSMIRSVQLSSGESLGADAVIATCDLPVVEKLTDRTYRRRLTWSPSAVVIHGAIAREVSRRWPGRHHTISFGAAWESTFREITAPRGRGRLMSDPSLLLTRPGITLDAAGVAPGEIAENPDVEPLSILAPVPNLDSARLAWDSMGSAYVEEILSVLESRGFKGISSAFAIGMVDTPSTWAAKGLGAGSPFAAAHRVTQTGPMRTRNLGALGLRNLVLAGSTTTPGVGVPTAMLSGALAARRVTQGGVR